MRCGFESCRGRIEERAWFSGRTPAFQAGKGSSILPARTLTLASFCALASTYSVFQRSTSVTWYRITVRQNVIAMPKLVCGRTRTGVFLKTF